MIWRKRYRRPADIRRAYEDGLMGAPADPAYRESMLEQGHFCDFAAVGSRIRSLHKKRPRMLLYKSLRKHDGGAFSSEGQTEPDCTSHATRNCVDNTRACEIDLAGEVDQFVTRSATEYIYAGRGHRGGGMNPGRATRIVQQGQLLRKDYRDQGGPDLRKYNGRIGASIGGRIPESWKAVAENELRIGDWVATTKVDEALDLMANGSCGHGGSQFGSSREVGRDGLNLRTTSWNHDMAHGGYDLTEDFFPEPVVFVPNSWGAWNEPNPVWVANQDVYGPWIPGMLVVPLDLYEKVILKACETYFMSNVVGDAIRPLQLADTGTDFMVAA